eukprot:3812242-Prymnesium_polylepis.1
MGRTGASRMCRDGGRRGGGAGPDAHLLVRIRLESIAEEGEAGDAVVRHRLVRGGLMRRLHEGQPLTFGRVLLGDIPPLQVVDEREVRQHAAQVWPDGTQPGRELGWAGLLAVVAGV